MEFLAILIAVAIMHLRGTGMPLQQDGWFHTLRGLLAPYLAEGPRQVVLVVLPTLVVLVLQAVLDGRFYGLAELVFFVVVLIYSLGRGRLTEELGEYLLRWSRSDFQAAYRQLATDPGVGLGEDDGITNPAALHAVARRQLYYRGFERGFVVLFWFFFLGPAGAVVYRMAALVNAMRRAEGLASEDSTLLRWIEWLPVRVCGLAFALVGHFDRALYAWQRVMGNSRIATAEALELCGNAALDLDVPADGEDRAALIERGTRELQAVASLGGRAFILWLVIMGLLAMIF